MVEEAVVAHVPTSRELAEVPRVVGWSGGWRTADELGGQGSEQMVPRSKP